MLTPSLQEKCRLLTPFGTNKTLSSDLYNTISVLQNFNTTKGWASEMVWMFWTGGDRQIQVQAVRIDMSLTAYPRIPDTADLSKTFGSIGDRERPDLWAQELFVAQNVVFPINETHAQEDNDKTWADFGFSPEDIASMTDFILGGTTIYGGALVVLQSQLLALVPNWVVGLLTAVVILCCVAGFVAGRGVDPIVKRPLTEVVSATAAQGNNDTFFNKHVANLTLRKRQGRDAVTIMAEGNVLLVKNESLGARVI
jgi:hypothetical protein